MNEIKKFLCCCWCCSGIFFPTHSHLTFSNHDLEYSWVTLLLLSLILKLYCCFRFCSQFNIFRTYLLPTNVVLFMIQLTAVTFSERTLNLGKSSFNANWNQIESLPKFYMMNCFETLNLTKSFYIFIHTSIIFILKFQKSLRYWLTFSASSND